VSHATLVKFGYPDTCILEGAHWCVLLRPQQVTLGALVLCAKDANVTSLGGLPIEAIAEFGVICGRIERGLARFIPYDKINYLALMMVDPHVHFHVLPRFATAQVFDGVTFADAGWPGPPDLKSHVVPPARVFAQLKARLVDAFGQAG
jgi:diadenosine tetraphosphate (Ap4A) HIT family hydrolase